MSEQYTALKALADETRLRVIGLLAKRAYCVRALARKVGVSESAVSQHMKILKNAGLVTGVKWGYHMHYQVNREALRALDEAVSALSEPVQAECAPKGGNCDEFVEEICRRKTTRRESSEC